MTALFAPLRRRIAAAGGVSPGGTVRQRVADHRTERRRRQHHVPVKLDAAVVLHRLTLRKPGAPLRVVLLITGLLGSRESATTPPPTRSPTVWPTPGAPSAGGDRHRMGSVEELGRRAAVDEIGGAAPDAQRGRHHDDAGGAQPGRRCSALRGGRGLAAPRRRLSDAGAAAGHPAAAGRRRRRRHRTGAPPAFGTLLGEPMEGVAAGRRTWRAALLPDAKPYSPAGTSSAAWKWCRSPFCCKPSSWRRPGGRAGPG